MRRSLFFSSLAAGAMALMLTSTVDAQRGGRGRGERGSGPEGRGPAVADGQTRGRGPGRMAEALGLTAEQQAAIARIRTNAREKTAPLAAELRVAARNLRQEIVAAPGDTGAVKALAERVSTLRQQIADARLEARIATAALLTDEQRAKLPTAMGPRAGNRLGARFGRGPGRIGRGGDGPGFEGPRHGPRGGGPRGARGPAAGV